MTNFRRIHGCGDWCVLEKFGSCLEVATSWSSRWTGAVCKESANASKSAVIVESKLVEIRKVLWIALRL